MTNPWLLVVCAMLAALPGTALGAQQLSAMRVGLTAPPVRRLDSSSAPSVAASSSVHRPRRWPYVVGGAVVGAAAGGIWLARQVARTDDAMVFPLFAAVPVALGSGLGALGGLTISVIVDP